MLRTYFLHHHWCWFAVCLEHACIAVSNIPEKSSIVIIRSYVQAAVYVMNVKG